MYKNYCYKPLIMSLFSHICLESLQSRRRGLVSNRCLHHAHLRGIGSRTPDIPHDRHPVITSLCSLHSLQCRLMSYLHSCRVPPTVVVLRSSRRRHKPHCHKSKLNRIKLHTISNTSVFRQKVWGLFIRRCGMEPLFVSFNRILSKSMQHCIDFELLAKPLVDSSVLSTHSFHE